MFIIALALLIGFVYLEWEKPNGIFNYFGLGYYPSWKKLNVSHSEIFYFKNLFYTFGRVQVFKNGSACYWFEKCELAKPTANVNDAFTEVEEVYFESRNISTTDISKRKKG